MDSIHPHVCILSCQHVPDDMRVTHKIGMSFRQAGFRVTWVGPRRERRGDDYGIDFRYYPPGKGRLGRLMHYRKLFKLASQVDNVDIWYGVEPDSGKMAVRLARRFGGKAVMSIHEIYHDEMLGRWARGPLRKIMGQLVLAGIRRVFSQCDLVEGVGITRIEPYDTGKTPWIIVRHCSPREFAGDKPARPFTNPSEIVLLHGKATVWHGTREAVKAVALAAPRLRLRPRLLMIAPNVPMPSVFTQDSLMALAAQEHASQYIDVRQPVPYREMFDIMRGCDVGLILYGREFGIRCMPNRVFEFMAMGIPIIAPSYAMEMEAIVAKEKSGLLVDTEDPQAIADAIVYLADHPDEAREMGQRGRAAFLDRLNWETESRPLLDWIRKNSLPDCRQSQQGPA